MIRRLNTEGIAGGKVLLVFAILAIIILGYFSGVIDFGFGIPGEGEYEQTVIRRPTDLGLKVPIYVKLSFFQDANTGAEKTNLEVDVKPRHAPKASGNYVPDPELVNAANFNSKVANVGDTRTPYAVSGNSFVAKDVPLGSDLISDTGMNFGLAQNNYKVWTKSNVYNPPSSPIYEGHILFIQCQFAHYRKATNQQLNSYTVTFGIFYKMADYNKDSSYSKTYKYYVYVPFDDFAFVEDIKWEVKGYYDSCLTTYRSVTATVKQYWTLNIFGFEIVKVCRSVSSTVTTEVKYTWQNPRAFPIDNSDTYGSHRYTYKIR